MTSHDVIIPRHSKVQIKISLTEIHFNHGRICS